jgi:hypothetical protein
MDVLNSCRQITVRFLLATEDFDRKVTKVSLFPACSSVLETMEGV